MVLSAFYLIELRTLLFSSFGMHFSLQLDLTFFATDVFCV